MGSDVLRHCPEFLHLRAEILPSLKSSLPSQPSSFLQAEETHPG